MSAIDAILTQHSSYINTLRSTNYLEATQRRTPREGSMQKKQGKRKKEASKRKRGQAKRKGGQEHGRKTMHTREANNRKI